MRRIIGYAIAATIGGIIGGAIVWWLTESRLKSYKQQLLALRNQIICVENKILEFQATYYEDRADILYQYSLLKREVEQLKQTALSPQKKRELDAWLDFLEKVTVQKIEEQKKVRSKPTIYVT